MKQILSAAVAAAVMAGTLPAQGAVSAAEWEQFKAQFAEMASRVDALEAENAQLRQLGAPVPEDDLSQLQADVVKLQAQSSASSWTENLALAGDFRYRYEYIDVENVDSRERNRIRARMAVTARLPSNVEVGMGVATGGDDPVSTNQTLGGGGSSKELRLDKAYAKWNLTDGFYLQAGKFSNPLYRPQKSGLLWDGDWRPEGISAGWQSEHLFVNAIGNWLESDTRNGNDEFAWGFQGGTHLSLGDARLTASLAYYDFPTAGATPFFGDKDDPDFFGNSSTEDGLRYLYNYEMVELGGDLAMSLFEMPLSIYGNFVQNQDADDYDTGWLAGVKLGKTGGPGSWSIGYQYQDLEADAVLGLLSDSDFAGGGTDGKGHLVALGYGVNKQWSLGLKMFLSNEAGEKNLADQGGALDYDRIQLDTKFKY